MGETTCLTSPLTAGLSASNTTLGLTLESRRLRGDLIEVFKTEKRFINIDRNIFFFTETLEFVRGIDS